MQSVNQVLAGQFWPRTPSLAACMQLTKVYDSKMSSNQFIDCFCYVSTHSQFVLSNKCSIDPLHVAVKVRMQTLDRSDKI